MTIDQEHHAAIEAMTTRIRVLTEENGTLRARVSELEYKARDDRKLIDEQWAEIHAQRKRIEELEVDVKDLESDHGCPVHGGEIHGGEAEELRNGIEELLLGGTRVRRSSLIALLDHVDARDSLAHLERQDRVAELRLRIADLDAERDGELPKRGQSTTRETSASIAAWQNETFGQATTQRTRVEMTAIKIVQALFGSVLTADLSVPRPNLSRAVRAAEELAELIVLLVARDNDPGAGIEVADIQIVLAGIPAAHGQEQSTLVDQKMAINRARRWNVTGDGHGQHVDEAKS